MIWLYLLGLLLLLCLPWLFLKWLEARHKKRERYWQKNGDRHSRYDSITRLLRSSKVTPKSPTPVVVRAPLPSTEPLQQTARLKPKHQRNVERATQILELLRSQTSTMDSEQALKIVIGSLRRVDPFVFEELLLHCFKDAGYQVVRNSRYTGDDGIDGRIYRDGKLYLVQAKRYAGLIDAGHLREFENTLGRYSAAGGFFVHTGRTGDTAKAVSRQQGQVTLLSGMGLVDFVLARRVAAVAVPPIAVDEADTPW
jgi:restriction system protein